MAIEAHHLPEFPPRLNTFAKRLRFVRVCVAGFTKAEHMAKRCGFKPSTYATWEADSDPPRLPHDVAWVARRIHDEFPAVPAEWLLLGGELTLFPYCDGSLIKTQASAADVIDLVLEEDRCESVDRGAPHMVRAS